MKKSITITLIILFGSFSLAQSSTNKLLTTLDENKLLTLPEIQKSFNDYWAPYNVTDGYLY